MTSVGFTPTREQAKVIEHEGSAFVAACPGSGKTRVLVERARRLLLSNSSARGIALLSFTTAAVSELESRLRREAVLSATIFPNFIGTFDAFLWQFLIAPFGVPGCSVRPRLIPDMGKREVRPYASARALTLECFDQATGNAIPEALVRANFTNSPTAYETAARALRARARERGELDFDGARQVALARLRDGDAASVLASALSARFMELVVDEAQDCNPVDLEIIDWFRAARVPVKVICDPNQSIFGFRGGVTDQLMTYAQTFQENERLVITGNFRSSRHIVKAVFALRKSSAQAVADQALGPHQDEPAPVHVLSYSGRSVPASVGRGFRALTDALGLKACDCPVVASTRRIGASALGHASEGGKEDLTYRLALAVSDFHNSFEIGNRRHSLEALHQVLLKLAGQLEQRTYHQYMVETQLEPSHWRPQVLELAEALRFEEARFPSPIAWLDRARELLAPTLPVGGRSIKQWLPRNEDLRMALTLAPASGHCARTIHSVKGMEFPAVCVVMSPKTTKEILDCLCTTDTTGAEDEVRKIYVGTSRAQRLLAIAAPKSQAARLSRLLEKTGANVRLTAL